MNKDTHPSEQTTTSGNRDHDAALTIRLGGQVTIEIHLHESPRKPSPTVLESQTVEDEIFSGLLAHLERASEHYGGIPSHKILGPTIKILHTLIEHGTLPRSLDERFVAKLIALIDSIDERTDTAVSYLRETAADLREMFLDDHANGDGGDDDDDDDDDDGGDDQDDVADDDSAEDERADASANADAGAHEPGSDI